MPDFFSLPPELRNMAYNYTIADRSMTLFATNGRVRTEGLPRTFVVHFGYASHPCLLPPKRSLATPLIQNLELNINLGGSPPRLYSPDLLYYFGGADIRRESCSVFLNIGSQGYLGRNLEKQTLFKALGSLTGFRIVRVRLEVQRFERWSVEKCEMGMYAEVAEVLESGLGKSEMTGGGDERWLVFRRR